MLHSSKLFLTFGYTITKILYFYNDCILKFSPKYLHIEAESIPKTILNSQIDFSSNLTLKKILLHCVFSILSLHHGEYLSPFQVSSVPGRPGQDDSSCKFSFLVSRFLQFLYELLGCPG